MATYSFERVVTPGEPDYLKVATVGAGAPAEPIEYRIPLGGETLVRRLGGVTIASTPRGNIWSVEANKEVESISTDDPPYICNNGLKIVALNSSILGVVTGPPDPLIVEIEYKPI